jgi:signal transduction histidine kinase
VDSQRVLSLSHRQNDMNFEFSVPDYSGEKNINLFYRFRNKDTAWIKVNSSQLLSLSFINLAPGKYDLEVRAVNKERAGSRPYSLSFVIHDPFWGTWWFYLILVLFTVFLSWIIYRSRLKRKISYIQKIEQIRKDENEKVRKAAALDLHDEFGNGLTRISMLIEMIRIHMAKENREAHKLLDLISQNSNRLYQGTKDFIWSINPGKDNLYEIVIRIKDYADELFYGNSVTFELNGLNEELKQIKQPPTTGRNITMIFKEALSNVLKHARAGKVRFTVRHNPEKIYLILEDNGMGFEMKDYKNSFGITNIQQRAGRLSAEVNISSAINKGTEIVLILNLNNEENDNIIA